MLTAALLVRKKKKKKLETTQKSISAKWINELQHIHNGYHTSNENKQTTTTCNTMDDLTNIILSKRSQDTKEYMLLMTFIKAQKTRQNVKSQKRGCPGGAGNDWEEVLGDADYMELYTSSKFIYPHSEFVSFSCVYLCPYIIFKDKIYYKNKAKL